MRKERLGTGAGGCGGRRVGGVACGGGGGGVRGGEGGCGDEVGVRGRWRQRAAAKEVRRAGRARRAPQPGAKSAEPAAGVVVTGGVAAEAA